MATFSKSPNREDDVMEQVFKLSGRIVLGKNRLAFTDQLNAIGKAVRFAQGIIRNSVPAVTAKFAFEAWLEEEIHKQDRVRVVKLNDAQAKCADNFTEDDFMEAMFTMTDVAVLLGIPFDEVIERVVGQYRLSVSDMAEGYIPSV